MIEIPVHHSDVERAIPLLRRLLQKEGRSLKMKKKCHEKKSEKKAKKKAEARKKRHQQHQRRQWCN